MYFTYGTLFLIHAQTCFPISSHFLSAILQPILYRGGTAWTGDLKCIEVKTGFGILGVIPIRIQGLYDQQFKHIYSRNFFFFLSTIYPSLGLHTGRPSYKRSPQLSIKNIQDLNPDPEPCFWDSHWLESGKTYVWNVVYAVDKIKLKKDRLETKQNFDRSSGFPIRIQ